MNLLELPKTAKVKTVDGELNSRWSSASGWRWRPRCSADVNATSGIQTQAYATSVLATLRKGLTKLGIFGYAASSIVLNPGGLRGRRAGAVDHQRGRDPRSAVRPGGSRQLFGLPIVVTVAQAAGKGHVLAADAVAVDTDTEGVGVAASEFDRLNLGIGLD